MDRVERFNALVKAMDGETLFRPSSASRWLNCHGSTQLVAKAPKDRTSSRYAQQGTAAHIVLHHALSDVRQPDEWTDRMVQLDDKGLDGWFVDAEMAEAIQFTVNVVNDYRTPDTEMFLEHFLSLQPLDPSDFLLGQNRGTADVVLIDKKRRKLTILDLKYGQGVMVAGDSPQLLDYALMGLVNFQVEGGWAEVESVVIQPRARNEDERVKAHSFSPYQLMNDFAGRAVDAMENALEPDAPLTVDPSGSWCRWCPAKATCPALQAAGLGIAGNSDMVAAAMRATTPMPPVSRETPVLPDITKMTGEAIALVLERREVYDAWISAVEDRASAALRAGIPIPGWELKQSLGNRAWVDPKVAETEIRKMGVSILDMYTPQKLLSPAQMEKLLPKDKREDMNELVIRPEGELKLKRAKAALTST